MVKKSSEGETTTTPQSQCDSNSTDSTVQDQSGSTSNVPIASTESYSWCEILRRTRAQEQSVEAGMVLCICAMGLNYGSIFFDVFNVEDSTGWFKEIGCHSSTAGCSIIISVTWYVGAIAGSIFCGLKQITWPARMTNYCASVILSVACVSSMIRVHITFVCMTLLLSGFCYGFIYITYLTQIGDNISKTVRGYVLTVLPIMTTVAMLVVVGFAEFLSNQYEYFRYVYNSFVLIIVLCAGFITLSNTKEPLSRLLKMNYENKALDTLIELRNETQETWTIRTELDEKKLMVGEDFAEYDVTCGFQTIFFNGNLNPLYMVCILKVMNVLSSNLVLFFTSVQIISKDVAFAVKIGLITTKIVVMFIPKFSIDRIGRRWLLLVGGLGCSICMMLFAANISNLITIRHDVIIAVIIFIHVFAALGIEPVQHVYAAEAFSLDQRNASIAFATCIEYIEHIGIILLWTHEEDLQRDIFFYASSATLFLLTILMFFKLPETKSKTIRQCRIEFNNCTFVHSEPTVRTIGNAYA